MVRILTNDDNFNPIERSTIKSVKNQFSGRINDILPLFFYQKRLELGEVRLLEFTLHNLQPSRFHLWINFHLVI